MKKIFTPQFFTINVMVFMAVATRFLPHSPNFTAIGAMALFSGATMSNKRMAFLIPMLAMFLSDLVIGFHNVMIPVYACFALTVGIGIFIRNKQSVAGIGIAAISSSLLFFLITNLPFWYGTTYPSGFNGLIESYTAGLPFLSNQITGDLIYSAVLFGVFALAKRRMPLLVK